jgi:hypothetical protein
MAPDQLVVCESCRNRFGMMAAMRREVVGDTEFVGMVCPRCGTVFPMAATNPAIAERTGRIRARADAGVAYTDLFEENKAEIARVLYANRAVFEAWGPVYSVPGDKR